MKKMFAYILYAGRINEKNDPAVYSSLNHVKFSSVDIIVLTPSSM